MRWTYDQIYLMSFYDILATVKLRGDLATFREKFDELYKEETKWQSRSKR